MLLRFILNLTWFKWAADRISPPPPAPPTSRPHFLSVSSELVSFWEQAVLFVQCWRMWFQRAGDLTHILSAVTLAEPQAPFQEGWCEVGLRCENWGFLIGDRVVNLNFLLHITCKREWCLKLSSCSKTFLINVLSKFMRSTCPVLLVSAVWSWRMLVFKTYTLTTF